MREVGEAAEAFIGMHGLTQGGAVYTLRLARLTIGPTPFLGLVIL